MAVAEPTALGQEPVLAGNRRLLLSALGPMEWTGLGLVVLITLVAIFTPLIAQHDPYESIGAPYQSVGHGGLLGTVGATGSGGNATQYLARQIRALGQPGDLLLVLSATGNDVAVLEALDAAHERDMMAVVLTGRTGGSLAGRVRETDVLICVPHDRAARVRETHTLVLHCLCDGVDAQLLGEQEMPL